MCVINNIIPVNMTCTGTAHVADTGSLKNVRVIKTVKTVKMFMIILLT